MSNSPQRLAAPPETVDDDPLVTTIMTARLVAVTCDSPVSTALVLMARTGVRHLPVLEGQTCVGLVLEADLVRCLAQSGSLSTVSLLRVADLTRPVGSLPSTARVSDAARQMVSDGCHAVLVIDQGRLRGIVTSGDLIRSLAAGPRRPAQPE